MERFRIDVSDTVLDDLRDRLRRTRWPRALDVGWSDGTDPGYLRELVAHWVDGYDWRAAERRFDEFEHLLVPVDGVRVHVVRPTRRRGGIPLLLLHGWPGSFVQMLDLMDRLADDFDVVTGSLPGFGWSDPPSTPGWGEARMADVFDRVMTDALGYARYAVHGSDFGAGVANWLAARRADHLIGVHVGGTTPRADGITEDDSPALQRFAEDVARWRTDEVGYGAVQGTKPATLAAALNDSPAGLAAWIVEKFRRWSDCDGDVERRFTKDQLLTNVTTYWVTGSIGSSIRLYKEADDEPDLRAVDVPIAYLMSDRDMLHTPREWVERSSRVDRWTQVDRGGHFLEWEEPDLVADDLRAFLLPLAAGRADGGGRMSSTTAAVRLPALTWVVASGTFLMATSEFLVAGVLPEMASTFRIDVGTAGLAVTVFAIGMILGAPTTVLLTLRLPRRGTLAMLLAVFALGHAVAALSGTFALLLVARFVTAFATGAFWAIAGQVAADAAGPGARTRALGIVQAGGMLANVVGVPVGSLIGQTAGWRDAFWLLGALALVGAGAVLRLVPPLPSAAVPSIRGELVALRSWRLWLVLLTCACTTGGVLSFYTYISPVLTGRTHLAESAVPAALVVFGLASLAGSVIVGRLGDAHPYRVVLAAGAVAAASLAALLGLSATAVPTFALVAVLGLTGLSIIPVLAYLAMHFGGPAPTLANALTPSAFNVGTAVGTAIVAGLLGTSLGLLAPLVVGLTGAVLVLAVFTTLTVLRRDAEA